MSDKIFLQALSDSTNNINLPTHSTVLIKALPEFSYRELHDIADKLHHKKMVEMLALSHKDFFIELKPKGKAYLKLLIRNEKSKIR